MKIKPAILNLQLLILTIYLFGALLAISEPQETEISIQIAFQCGKVKIAKIDNFLKLEVDGFFVSEDPGNPQLPYMLYDVLLPPKANTSSLKMTIESDDTYYLNVSERVLPAPPLGINGSVEWGVGKEIIDGLNLKAYNSSTYFPKEVVEIQEFGRRGVYLYVRLRFNPVQYNPKLGRLKIHREIKIKITLAMQEQNKIIISSTALNTEIASKQFINWEDASQWYTQTYLTSSTQYDFIIVTTNAIVQASNELSNYVAYLENVRGLKVKIITEDDYGTAEGQDRAINIRNWLKNNYLTLGFRYVLLIGNPDPDDPSDPNDSYGDVPMMMCWPRKGTGSDEEAPTDYFYADLTGDWDTDGDGFYCEYGDDPQVDFTPEVYVGRIPVYNNDYATLDKILRKIMNYGSNYGSWRHRIMLPIAISNYENEDGQGCDRTDGLDLPKYVIENILPVGWEHYVLYEREGLNPVPETAPYYTAPLTRDNVINEWKKGYGVVFWWAHGDSSSASRKYWDTDDGDGIPESDEMSWSAFITSSDTSLLNDSAPSIVYQSSCLNGYPEDSGNLGYQLLVNGSIATVSASRVSWYIVGYWYPRGLSDNAEIGYRFVEKMVKEGLPVGEALYEAKQELPHDSSYWWMNLFDFNLYGDPSLYISLSTSTITVDSQPQGSIFVKVDGVSITTPTSYNWEAGSTHTLEAISPINLGNDTRYVWESWSGGGAQIHTYTVPQYDETVTAFFKRQYNVTLTALPPDVGTVNPLGSNWIDEGSSINISATSTDPDFTFSNWVVDTSKISIADIYSPNTTALINGPGIVSANFTLTVDSLTLRIINCSVKAGIVNITVKLLSPNNVTGAEYALDDTNSTIQVTSPVDGAWGSYREFIVISFNATSYSEGNHTIYIRANDTKETSEWLEIYFYVRSLAKRYNLISLILKPISEYTAEDLGEAIGPQATLIAKWNTNTQEFEGYSPGISDPQDNFLIKLGQGYFVYLTSPATFVEVGVKP